MIKVLGFLPLKSRRELVLSLGVLKNGDSWGLSIRLEVEVWVCDNAWSEIRVNGGDSWVGGFSRLKLRGARFCDLG